MLEGNEDEVAIDSTEPRGEALLASYVSAHIVQ